LYCDFVLPFSLSLEREREEEEEEEEEEGRRGGLGLCLHLKTFVMNPQESQAALL
jgi:hypothetical protein